MSCATFGSLPFRSRSQHDLAAKSFQANNFVIWSQISKLFYRNDHHIETMSCTQHLGCYLEGQGHSMTFQQNSFGPQLCYLKSNLTTISQEWSAYWDNVSHATFELPPWTPRSQHDLSGKSGQKLCYLKSDFTTAFDKLLLCVQYLFGEHYPVPTGFCFSFTYRKPLCLHLCIIITSYSCYVFNPLLSFYLNMFISTKVGIGALIKL